VKPEKNQAQGQIPEEQGTAGDPVARREFVKALLRMGFAVPLGLGASIHGASSASEAQQHGDSHSDRAHSDGHTDTHSDSCVGVHIDKHFDTHFDAPHLDSHSDFKSGN
jgi:hypothetical protein